MTKLRALYTLVNTNVLAGLESVHVLVECQAVIQDSTPAPQPGQVWGDQSERGRGDAEVLGCVVNAE